MNFLAKAALFAVPLTLALGGSVAAEEWGTIKGQITWGGQEPPPRVKLDVNKDQVHCLGEGPIYSEEYVVGKGSGVKRRWFGDGEGRRVHFGCGTPAGRRTARYFLS